MAKLGFWAPRPNPKADRNCSASQRWAQVAAIIVSFAPAVWGGTWSVYTYANTAAKQEASVARARLIEAQQPFLQRQLEVFFETVELAGRLVADVPCTPKYEGDVQRFSALFWSTMTMVVIAQAALIGWLTW